LAAHPGRTIVPGDVIHLRLGDLAPVDVRLFDGGVEADESELTGELLAVEKSAGAIDGLKVQIFRRLRVR